MKDLNHYLNLNYVIEIKKIPENLGGGFKAYITVSEKTQLLATEILYKKRLIISR